MQNLLSRLGRDEDGSHLLEYALLALGVTAAVIQPSLVVGMFSRLADTLRLVGGQLMTFF